MESKSCQQRNVISLPKSKHKTSLPEKPNTWSNLLNKKSTSTNTVITSNKRPKQSSSISKGLTNNINKSIQCNSSKDELCQSSLLSVFNPIRTLQFLLKEVLDSPSIQNTNIEKIVNEMQAVVRRIINEYSESVQYSKLHVPDTNDNPMIPTKDNEYCMDLKYDNNSQENKYWLVLLGKISELENNYSQLTKNYSKTEEKLECVTSERDKLFEKFKELCDSVEMLNNRERKYLDTIAELKTKLIASEKLIIKQEAIINSLNNVSNKNQVKELVNENKSSEQHKYKAALKHNFDKLKIGNNFEDIEVFKLESDINQMKKLVLPELENPNIKSVSMTSLKSEENLMNFSKYSEKNKKYIEQDIDKQYTEYNRQASTLKLAKSELHELFETIKIKADHSQKRFNAFIVDNERNLSGISDEEDDCSNVTNFMSIMTDSSS